MNGLSSTPGSRAAITLSAGAPSISCAAVTTAWGTCAAPKNTIARSTGPSPSDSRATVIACSAANAASASSEAPEAQRIEGSVIRASPLAGGSLAAQQLARDHQTLDLA